MQESISPALFVFSQDFICTSDCRDIESNLDIDSNQQNHNINWIKYWEKNGYAVVLSTWKQKYKDYIIDDTQPGIKKEKLLLYDDIKIEENTEKIDKSIQELKQIHQRDWDILWQEHNTEVYLEHSSWYYSIYQQYICTLLNSLKNIPTKSNSACEVDQEEETIFIEISDELKQLRLLGLPTAFGGIQQQIRESTLNKSFPGVFTDDEDDDEDYVMDDIEDIASADLHEVQNKAISRTKKNKENRKLRKVPQLVRENKNLLKYWKKRFSLFSRFNEGIRLDYESWFSVTPEKVATHIAERLACDVVLDAFCGCGGNTIQLARSCRMVIAIDIDPIKIEMAKHNAEIYGVAQKIDFIVGDFLQIAASSRIKCDAIFLSPPWGGPGYKSKESYDIEKFLLPVSASELFRVCQQITQNIALFLPRNSNMQQIIKLAGAGNRCEVEHNYLDARLVALTALYGDGLLCKQA